MTEDKNMPDDAEMPGDAGKIDQSCRGIGELLVPYVDEELTPDEAAGVESHLAVCGTCRREAAALTRSLQLAMTVWSEAEEERIVRPVPNGGRRILLPAACAAAILLCAAAAGLWRLFSSDREDFGPAMIARQSKEAAPQPLEQPPQLPEQSFEEMEWEIRREESAARLRAAAEILGEQEGAEEYALNAYRFLAETLPNTQGGRAAARYLQQRQEN